MMWLMVPEQRGPRGTEPEQFLFALALPERGGAATRCLGRSFSSCCGGANGWTCP
jgi:hypothetical protein